jgi:D-3-phosphoglycerate dehydrogenase
MAGGKALPDHRGHPFARQDGWIRAGHWDRRGARPARRMKGRTMGFVAFGRIARALAERVSGFGMTLLADDPYLDAETITPRRG